MHGKKTAEELAAETTVEYWKSMRDSVYILDFFFSKKKFTSINQN